MSKTEVSEDVVVEVAGLSKIFKDFWGRPKAKAVNGIDFKVRKGEVFGLLGPNGSGKSTTIKMLLGLLYPSSGALQVFNASPRDVKTKERIGYLPEETYLYKYLTARETVDFFGSMFQLPRNERKKRTEQLLKMVGLKNSDTRPVGEFSKGMARRVGLAQALINDPDLIILDEPTSGLDPIGCREVKNLIKTLASRGKTVILSSHLLADVEDVVDRVVVLYGGQVRAHGTIDELLLVEEKTKIVTPRLSKNVLDRVLKILHEEYSADEMDVSHPRLGLESFFLDVVKRARSESIETSGAETGDVADYLKGGEEKISEMAESLKDEDLSDEEKNNQREELEEHNASAKLSSMALNEEDEDEEEEEAVKVKAEPDVPAVAVEDKLEALTHDEDEDDEVVGNETQGETLAEDSADISDASDKLKKMFGGK